jgi:nucleoside-triphosphatase THEP1
MSVNFGGEKTTWTLERKFLLAQASRHRIGFNLIELAKGCAEILRQVQRWKRAERTGRYFGTDVEAAAVSNPAAIGR